MCTPAWLPEMIPALSTVRLPDEEPVTAVPKLVTLPVAVIVVYGVVRVTSVPTVPLIVVVPGIANASFRSGLGWAGDARRQAQRQRGGIGPAAGISATARRRREIAKTVGRLGGKALGIG